MSKLNLDSWMRCSFSSSCAEAMWLTGREPAQESMMAFRPQKSHQPASSCHALSQGHAHTQTSPAKKLGLSRRVYVSLFSLSAAAISISAPLSPWANLWSHLELFQKKPVLQTDERIHTHTQLRSKRVALQTRNSSTWVSQLGVDLGISSAIWTAQAHTSALSSTADFGNFKRTVAALLAADQVDEQLE